MKKLLTIAALILLSASVFAQQEGRENRPNLPSRTTTAPLPPPLATRDVSGIVKDASGQTVIGATIILKSKTDTISVATNEDGVFIIKGVKQNTFNITIKYVGALPFVQKYAFSDTKKNVVLDPITLKTDSKELALVTINGTPSVTYKTDTVEYRASDYKVRENATVDELLKKMEGMEVGTDGSLTHQGQEVVKAKLNGKEYSGGSVAQAIQNLPADIVEKIQIVDDYGDQAARTGVKEGDPQKVLNITTRADRSVGNTARITGQYGSAGRYNAQVFAQRINANQQIGIIGNLRNTVLGVASSGLQGGATNDGGGGIGVGNNARGGGGGGGGNGASGGTTHSGSPSFNYRDQWSKNIQVIGSYAYTFNNNNAINDQYGTRYTTRGNSDFVTKSTSERDSKSHNLRYEMDINLDSANYLQLTPNFSYTNSTSANNSYSDNVNNYTNFEHQTTNGTNSTLNSSSSYGLTAFYLHVFKKPKRNFSLQFGISRSDNKTDGEQNTRYLNYADATQNTIIKDSTAHVLTNRTNNTTTYSGSLTYVEPLSTMSVLEFSASLSRRNNSSISLQDTVAKDGTVHPVAKYSSIYDYNVTDTRGTLSYRYNGTKLTLSLGASAVPFNLSGTKLNAAVGTNAETSISNFRVIPAFRFAYAWSRTERFTLNYNGRNQEPNFTEIQPFTDISNPNNIVVGNPDLKPSFTHSLTAQYNNYLANSKFNFSLGVTASQVDNAITQNTLQLSIPIFIDPVDPTKSRYRTIYETHYINLSGAKNIVARYNVAKQSNERAVNLSLNGNVTYSYTPAMSNSILYHQTNWRFDERFGPRITPNENFEINPFIGYDVSRYFTTLPPTTTSTVTSNSTQLNTTSLGITGRMYFFKTWQINYDATKKYITGITGGNTTPFIINAGFEKEFLARKNLVLTFNVYDLLHQNNYLQQSVTASGVTNTISNTLSRYFMVGLRLNLQKWSGTPQRNGQRMNRRGDGSFIYN
ncbi:outer membrane beta-barrel protein [Mucilaginibacter sp. UYCu711]|uniref:outer membrane beta-barrel protein n=1 Tax=Mucilaginibacter sp. UYCu711 TaxID=3156339 RepID=UPI003D220790